jgi:2-oxoglutarate dehydrogenase E2 component (dihydrolipoamide succinyltransferase)
LTAEKTVKTPPMGESITEGTLTQWHKRIVLFISSNMRLGNFEETRQLMQSNG